MRARLTEGSFPIAKLARDPDNPRVMSEEAQEGLAASLEEFGPLDICFNVRTGELVSGHQRIATLRSAGAKEVVRENGWAYIAHPKTGERFPVRFVDWDRERQRLANISANNTVIQGDFTKDALRQLELLTGAPGFDGLQLGALHEQLRVSFQALAGAELDDNLFESFASVGEGSETVAITLNVPRKYERLFEGLSNEQAIVVLNKWLKQRK
jgi:hypothetical protein